ncbi:MAG: 4Fe-4S binding protein [Euryarchaeota archaeon]|nr:4Fe-4S binding protein [Euryarchaeota archaeon]
MSVKVDAVLCMSCGGCVGVCPSLALELENGIKLVPVDEDCTDCGICERFCPVGAIKVDSQKRRLRER